MNQLASTSILVTYYVGYFSVLVPREMFSSGILKMAVLKTLSNGFS